MQHFDMRFPLYYIQWLRYVKPHVHLLEMREGENLVLEEVRGRDPDWEVHYALFARAFGQELQKLTAAEWDVHLYTPEDVLAANA